MTTTSTWFLLIAAALFGLSAVVGAVRLRRGLMVETVPLVLGRIVAGSFGLAGAYLEVADKCARWSSLVRCVGL